MNQEIEFKADTVVIPLINEKKNEVNNFDKKKENSLKKRRKTIELNEEKIDKIFFDFGNTWEEALTLLESGSDKVNLNNFEVISFDEKPGIQAIENVASDLPPVPGKYRQYGRDYEYKRHGTVDFICGINLSDGHIIAQVKDQHTSADFISWLKLVDSHYERNKKIIILLDNHSSHRSEELIKYLNLEKGRFEFVFTPKHASWLNTVESFFSSMARTILKNIRVKSNEELKERIIKYIELYNLKPTVYQWDYQG